MPPRPRKGLSREKILDAALAHIDAYGLDALSTRRLGTALGVEGMTLYHYVPNKAALLDGIVERLLMLAVADLLPLGDEPWTAVLRRVAYALHDTLRAHPAAVILFATRPVASPAAMRIFEDSLALMRTQGVPLDVAVDAVNAVTMFVTGHTLAEVGVSPGDHSDHGTAGTDRASDTGEDTAADVDPGAYPHLAEAYATGAGLSFDPRFATVVDMLVDGFAARAPQRSPQVFDSRAFDPPRKARLSNTWT